MFHPDKELGQLFEDVQLRRVFPDYKTFVDSVPRPNSDAVLAAYAEQKDQPGFTLKKFVLANFELPPPLPATRVDHEDSMLEHLRRHWKNLVREAHTNSRGSSLIGLPHPYVVPGGRFREMFYWDSYFTIIGLLLSDEDQLARDMIDNFAFLIDRYGYIPNGNRSYFLGRSQPPFFALMLSAYGEKHGVDAIAPYLPQLEREYLFWMDNHRALPNTAGAGKHLVIFANGDYLNRYFGDRDVARAEAYGKETRWAEGLAGEARSQFFRNLRAVCESGWDFSSRWFADGIHKASIHAIDIAPVDLNSLLFALENTAAQLHAHSGNGAQADFYAARAERRRAAIAHYNYDPTTGTYQDYDVTSGRRTGRLSLAMVYPLFTGVASDETAARVAKNIKRYFLKPGGLVTTLTQSGEQWDYPNGWAPLQYMAVEGLNRYGHKALALDIARRWLALNEKVYHEEGKMMEKYNVIDANVKAGGGEYPNQDGFGWTNGVDIAFYQLLAESQQAGAD